MQERAKMGDRFGATTKRRAALAEPMLICGDWTFIARDKHGREKWRETVHNVVVNEGLNHALDATLSGGSQITTWYIGLIGGSPTVNAADTMASHSGWAEVTAYDEATRVQWTDGGVSNQSVSNSGSPAEFTIAANQTEIGGAFLVSDNTKGGTSGTLYAAAAFSAGDKTLDDDDTLSVTATFTAAAS